MIDRLDSHGPSEPEWNMAEFFVLRNYRRRGIGQTAVQWVFAHHPGRWIVKQLAQNTQAIAFWRRVIGQATGGSYLETRQPKGIVQVFTV